MSNLAKTYQHIADILSFEVTSDELKKVFDDPNFDWDAIVVEGSKHLVLPAIYCRLKAKGLISIIPHELANYLKEIANINRNRNKAILKQIYSISKLLNDQKIEYLFLKGSAHLASNIYTDIAERMIGDIDILIKKSQLNEALNLMIQHGYRSEKQSLKDKFFGHKHLPRLTSESFISSVELHEKLFNKYTHPLINETELFTNQIKNRNVATPSIKDNLDYCILNYQIEDGGLIYQQIHFRLAYDSILLLKKIDASPSHYSDKNISSFLNLTGAFFQDIKNSKKNFNTTFYQFKLRHAYILKTWNNILFTKNYFSLLINRTYHFIINPEYRKSVLTDKKRILKRLSTLDNNKTKQVN